jgi:uncharacterized protein YcbK (DUF882 family)
MYIRLFIFLTVLVLSFPALANAPGLKKEPDFDIGLAGFSIKLNGLTNPYTVFGFSLLPGEKLDLETVNLLDIYSEDGSLKKHSNSHWVWTAPSLPGQYQLLINDTLGREMKLNLFVMNPTSDIVDGRLNGYRIDTYPSKPYRGLDSYLPPVGYIKVTPQNANTKVSPHFTLGQFVCKQRTNAKMKYIVQNPQLILKLESILSAINQAGIPSNSFHVMSGYRTPYYNHLIGNGENSRHIYGAAADIFIDSSPKNGQMDDVNRDGVVNRKDSSWLYNFIENLSQMESWLYLGGLGEYGATSTHGPFIHVDVRGYRARWGH